MILNNILLIDDDTTLNFLHTKLIERSGFVKKVMTSNYANIALHDLKNILNTTPDLFPELIFLDLNMPYMDGWEFLDEYEKFSDQVHKKTKLFILTSSIDPKDIERSKNYKTVNRFFSKPLSIEKLCSAMAINSASIPLDI
jgi:CheY-like chemotaxis protein